MYYKNRFISFSCLAFTAACILCACNSSVNKGEQSQAYKDSVAQTTTVMVDTASALKADWVKFKTTADEKIKQNEDTIQVIKMKVDQAGTKMKGKLNKEVAILEEKNNELKAKLTDYKDDGKDKFEKFRTDFDNSLDTMDINIKNFFTRKSN